MDGMTLETLQVIIEAQTKGVREEVAKVQNQVKQMTSTVNNEVNKVKNIFKSLGRFVATVGIGKIFVDSTKSAMKVEAAIQQITRTMGESTNQFLKWSKESALAFNMSQSDAMNYGAIFSNLVSTFSSGSKQTLQYTTDLLKASSIIASGTGRTMEDVMERIRSGLLGNTEAIEDLGVNVNVAMLQSTDAFKRFANGKSWDQLSFQTQQQIRLFGILEQTSNKFGGEVFNNTNSSLQQLVAILKDVALNIGNAFLPIMNVVLPMLSNFAMGLRTVTGYVATFMQTLFGFTPNTQKGVGGATNQVNALGGASDDAAKKAKKAKKEVQNLLGGFDEINTLSKNSGANESDGISTPGIGGGHIPIGLDVIEPNTSGIAQLVEKFKSLLLPAQAAFENFNNSLSPIVDNISVILLWLWDNILAPFATWTISDVIPAFFNLLSGGLDILNPILEVFMELGAWLWDSFLQPIASWTGGILVDVLNGLANVLKNIGKWMSDNKSIVEGITTAVLAFFAAWKLVELMAFIQMSGGIISAFNGIKASIWACTGAKLIDKAETMYLTALYAKDFVMSIINGTTALIKQAAQWTVNTGLKIADTVAQTAMNVATGAWNIICVVATAVTTAFGAAIAFLTSPIGLVIIAITAIIAVGILLYKHWDDVKAKAIEVWDGIKEKFNSFRDWLGNVFATDWTSKFGVLGNILNGFLATASGVINGIKAFFGGLIDFVVGIFTGNWSRAWEGVVNIFSGIFKTLSSIAKAPLNAVISLVNMAIDGLNRLLSFKMPDFLGGGQVGVNIPKIPYLARGGIVDNPTLAMVGEAGKEAVMPLENNTGWITQLADKVSSRMPQGNNDTAYSGDLILMIDGSVIGKVALNQLRKMQRQGGITLIPT